MLASTLVTLLTQIIAQQGDIPVGHLDMEFQGFCQIKDVEVRDYSNSGLGDDEDLAPKFIGLS